MIIDGWKWHYTALKSELIEDGFVHPTNGLSRLFKGITSSHNGDFYCLNCLHSFRTNSKPKEYERLCENNYYCKEDMPDKKHNIFKYNDGMESLKIPFVIYVDLECLLKKQQSCQNNLNKSYTEQKAINEPSGYSLDLVSSFDLKEKKHSFYRGKNCIKKFCKELSWTKRNDTINGWRKKVLWKSKNMLYIYQKKIVMIKNKKRHINYIEKLEIIVILQEHLEVLLMVFVFKIQSIS